jgi:hypothetical protein
MSAHADTGEHFAGSNRLFISVWIWLLVLTGFEVFLGYIHLPVVYMLVILMGAVNHQSRAHRRVLHALALRTPEPCFDDCAGSRNLHLSDADGVLPRQFPFERIARSACDTGSDGRALGTPTA